MQYYSKSKSFKNIQTKGLLSLVVPALESSTILQTL